MEGGSDEISVINLCSRDDIRQEGDTGIINLKSADHEHQGKADDDPEIVRLMIDLLYTGDFHPESVSSRTHVLVSDDRTFSSSHPIQAASEQPTATMIDIAHPLHTDDNHEAPRMPKVSKKDKRKKARTGWQEPSPEALVTGSMTTGCSEDHLQTNALVYVIAIKYDIRPLMHAALEKFKAGSKGNWDRQDLIATIPIVFHRIPDTETGLRGNLITLIENAHDLLTDQAFRDAVETVEGLAFELFRRIGSLARCQKICKCCTLAFLSRCALDGCETWPSSKFGGGHSCDLEGPWYIYCGAKNVLLVRNDEDFPPDLADGATPLMRALVRSRVVA